MPSHDELKAELNEIAAVLEKYPPAVQPRVFELLISSYLGTAATTVGTVLSTAHHGGDRAENVTPTPQDLGRVQSGIREKTSDTRRRIQRGKAAIGLIKDLDLSGGGEVPSLSTFAAERAPHSNVEFTALAVYYLALKLGLTGITLAHINTCYNAVDRKPPSNFLQNVYDTSSSRYGYIDAKNTDDIKIAQPGVVLVEHKLPRAGRGELGPSATPA